MVGRSDGDAASANVGWAARRASQALPTWLGKAIWSRKGALVGFVCDNVVRPFLIGASFAFGMSVGYALYDVACDGGFLPFIQSDEPQWNDKSGQRVDAPIGDQ